MSQAKLDTAAAKLGTDPLAAESAGPTPLPADPARGQSISGVGPTKPPAWDKYAPQSGATPAQGGALADPAGAVSIDVADRLSRSDVEIMAAALVYHFADPSLSHLELAGAIRAAGGRLPLAELSELGVEWSLLAAAFATDDPADLFTLEDARVWAKTPVGKPYLSAYQRALASGAAIPRPRRVDLESAAGTKAGEIELVGRHDLTGERDGSSFTGSLVIRPDGTYRIERPFAQGQAEVEQGHITFAGSQMLLNPVGGRSRPDRRP